jgi:hypothetical protein
VSGTPTVRPRRTVDWNGRLTSPRYSWWPSGLTEEQQQLNAQARAYYAARDEERRRREAEVAAREREWDAGIAERCRRS